MKIVHITQFFHPLRGYQENHLSILQAKEGHTVTLICTDDLELWGINKEEMKEMDISFSKKYNITVIRLVKVFEISTRIFVNNLGKTLDKIETDLLIIHGVSIQMAMTAMKWGAKHNIKMIVDDHMVEAGTVNSFSKLIYKFFRIIFPIYLKIFNIHVDKWIAVSGETKEFMIRNYGIKDNIDIVPLGYDDNTVFYDKNGGKDWLIKNNLSIDINYILYIGKFDYMKNPIDILEGYQIFISKNENYRLLLVGDPSEEYAAKLKNRIDELNLKNYVLQVKSVPNDQIRKVFSVVEMAIWPHGSSMAMLEAMACNCPVIAPDIQVNSERLSNDRGTMFKEDNSVDLSKKIELVLKNKNVITLKAKEWVEQFAWSKLVDKFY